MGIHLFRLYHGHRFGWYYWRLSMGKCVVNTSRIRWNRISVEKLSRQVLCFAFCSTHSRTGTHASTVKSRQLLYCQRHLTAMPGIFLNQTWDTFKVEYIRQSILCRYIDEFMRNVHFPRVWFSSYHNCHQKLSAILKPRMFNHLIAHDLFVRIPYGSTDNDQKFNKMKCERNVTGSVPINNRSIACANNCEKRRERGKRERESVCERMTQSAMRVYFHFKI